MFSYEPYRSPFANSIAESIARRGDIAARAAERLGDVQAGAQQHLGDIAAQARLQSGQGWSQALMGATQAIGSIPNQIAVTRAAQQNSDLRGLQLDTMKRDQAGQQAVAGMMRGDQLPAGDPGPRQESYLTADGLWDVKKLTAALGQAGFGDKAGELLKSAEGTNDSILKHQQLEQQATQQHAVMLGDLADGALKMSKMFGTPLAQAMDFVVQPAIATKRINPQEYEQVKQQILAMPPEQQQGALTQLIDQAAKLSPSKTLAEGAIETDRYGRTVAKGGEKPPTEPELAMRAAAGDPQAIAAMNRLKPTPNRTAEQDRARYIDIQTSGSLGKPVTPEDTAWAASYEKEKGLNTDKTIAAANTRLARVQSQQNELQRKAQNFTEAQAGRKELTEKYEAPYLDAVEKAETLRSVIDAAKHGNQEAAALTPLLATLGVTTSEGVKRINMAEIATVKGAGSLFERIKGQIGGAVAGQPLSADLQNDILKLADLLETSARKKYENGFQTITTRYGLKDEQIRPVPTPAASASPNQPIKVGGFSVVVK